MILDQLTIVILKTIPAGALLLLPRELRPRRRADSMRRLLSRAVAGLLSDRGQLLSARATHATLVVNNNVRVGVFQLLLPS